MDDDDDDDDFVVVLALLMEVGGKRLNPATKGNEDDVKAINVKILIVVHIVILLFPLYLGIFSFMMAAAAAGSLAPMNRKEVSNCKEGS